MNLLVSEMLGVSARNDLEIQSLEELLNDDCKCESKHNYTPYCEGKAVYRIGSCMPDYNSCKSAADDPVTGMKARMPHRSCLGCGKLASECWTIRPI